MFILEFFEIDWAMVFAKVYGLLRKILFLIDSLGLTFIDDAYDLMISAITAFDGEKIASLANDIAKNCYIIIGIFALFRIALILVNTIIDPDKLTDKSQGFGNVLMRFVITIVLFVMVPFIFDMSRELQAEIINNSYISKILIGIDLTGGGTDNAGAVVKDIAVRSLIYPDSTFYDKKNEEIKDDVCSGDCKIAVENWKGNASYEVISYHLPDFVMVDEEAVYVYKYTPIVVLLVGGFITYVLLSFAIDIAMRSVELAVLEILAPIFLVTYIDPKSSSNGPFKKWLTACGKTYLNLFIKIAVICIMLLFISKLDEIFSTTGDSTGLLQLIIYIAILIFAKKAPKWLGDLLGVDGSSLGGLGIGKKLGEMAGIGGAVTKGIGAAKKGTAKFMKNRAKEKILNRAAGLGGVREQIARNRESGERLTSGIWGAGRSATKRQVAKNKAARKLGGMLGEIQDSYMGGRKTINPEAMTRIEKAIAKAELAADRIKAKALGIDVKQPNWQELLKKYNKIEAGIAAARKLYKDANGKSTMMLGADGDRVHFINEKGEKAYIQATSAKEFNESCGKPLSMDSLYEQYAQNLLRTPEGLAMAKAQGLTISADGKLSTSDAITFAKQNMSMEVKAIAEQTVAQNKAKVASKYQDTVEQAKDANDRVIKIQNEYDAAIRLLEENPTYKENKGIISAFEKLTKDYEKNKEKLLKLKEEPDYIHLTGRDYNDLTPEEQNRLASYNKSYKKLREIVVEQADEINKSKPAAEIAMADVKETEKSLSNLEISLTDAKNAFTSWSMQKEKESKTIIDINKGVFEQICNAESVTDVAKLKMQLIDMVGSPELDKQLTKITSSTTEEEFKKALEDLKQMVQKDVKWNMQPNMFDGSISQMEKNLEIATNNVNDNTDKEKKG